MSKSKRISVPVDHQIESYLRDESSKTGESVAVIFSKLAVGGLQQRAIDEQLSDLKSALQNRQPETNNEQKLDYETAQILTEISSKLDQLGEHHQAEQGIFMTAAAFMFLFEEVYFSSFLSVAIVIEMAPGSAKQPVGLHLQSARQKAKLAVQEFLKKSGA